jgi:hypothetical protein
MAAKAIQNPDETFWHSDHDLKTGLNDFKTLSRDPNTRLARFSDVPWNWKEFDGQK